ncbi:phosphatase PAP2 family protein [Paraflavitalea pollutisoli]|uniref:phosphatase PAP2 family protein n=1 Tax=Paraflavitalea pollutisoli TaxID=3034143 RepID=UPI0023EAE5B2|nr:phosphatase PAP2 family protein [Paraflavitalea sp. H1-2-19X]
MNRLVAFVLIGALGWQPAIAQLAQQPFGSSFPDLPYSTIDSLPSRPAFVPAAPSLISPIRLSLLSLADSPANAASFWQTRFVRMTAVPIGLFAASALTWGEREEIRKFRNRYIPTFRHHYDDYLQYVPALAVFGLNAAGVKGKHSMKRAFVSYAFSAAIMGLTVNTIKYTAKVQRPSGDDRNSFPSGHTANSFMNATFLNKEYGQYRHPLYGVAAYTMSTATAVGRQLNNRHWISDVLAGAGIGILSTELGYFFADKIFKDKGVHKPLRSDPFPINKKPSFLELRLGFAVASSGDLIKSNKDLHAERGFNFGLEGAWFFHKNVGIGGEFAFTSFPANDDKLVINDPTATLLGDNYYTQPMGVRYLHIGPFFSLPLRNNWFITAKLNAGSSTGAEGNIMVQVRDEFQSLITEKELPYIRYKPEYTFSWSSGIGIQKRVARNLGLKAFAAYFDSDHDFDVDVLREINQDGSYRYERSLRERVRFNHWTFGLAVTAFIW